MTYKLPEVLDYNAIKNFGTIDLEINHEFDMSKVAFAKPDGIVLFRLILHKLCNENGNKVRIIFPEKNLSDYSVRRYLAHIEFFNGLKVTLSNTDYIYLTSRKIWKGSSSVTHTKIIDAKSYDIDQEMNKFLTVLVNFLKENGLIREILENKYKMIFDEAFSNLRDHSIPEENHQAYFCAQAQVYQQSRIVLSIGDNGVGILNSLNTVHNFSNDKEAIKAAVERKTSRMLNVPDKGGGLQLIFNKCWELELNCLLKSGSTELFFNHNDKNFHYVDTPFYSGTQLIIWN